MPTPNQEPSKDELWKQLDAEEAAGITPAAPGASSTSQGHSSDESAPARQADATTAGASGGDEWRAKIDGLESTITKLQERLRNAEGHIGGVTNQLRQAQEAARAAQAAGASGPTAAELSEASVDPEAMQRLKEEYPEFGELYEKTLKATLAPVLKELNELRKQRQPQLDISVVDQKLDAFRREQAVESVHPGWRNEVSEEGFRPWLESQPREVQMLARSDDPSDAIRLLNLRKEAKSRLSSNANPSPHLAAAASIPSGRSTSVKTVDLDSMTKEQYWAHLDRLEAQKA